MGIAGNTRRGRTRRIRQGLLLGLLAPGAAFALPAYASAAVACDFDAGMKKVDITMTQSLAENVVILRTVPGGALDIRNFAGDQLCSGSPGPTTTTVDTVNVTQFAGATSGRVEIHDPASFAPGATAEPLANAPSAIEFDIDLGNTSDIGVSGLVLHGTSEADDFRVDDNGVDTDVASESITTDDDISITATNRVTALMGNGTDTFSGQGAGVLATATGIDLSGQGGQGSDLLIGGDAENRFDGGDGNDVVEPGPDYNILGFGAGEAGSDTLSYENAGGGVNVHLGEHDGEDTGQGMLVQTGYENVRGSGFDDELTGNRKANKLFGLTGVDQLFAKDHREDNRIDCGEGDNALEKATRDKGLDPKPKSC